VKKLNHITVDQEVYQKLKSLGRAGDSFNDVLINILQIKKEGKKEEKQIVTV